MSTILFPNSSVSNRRQMSGKFEEMRIIKKSLQISAAYVTIEKGLALTHCSRKEVTIFDNSNTINQKIPFKGEVYAKPRVSLTAPNRNHFAQVSLTNFDFFLDAIAKAKKLIGKS